MTGAAALGALEGLPERFGGSGEEDPVTLGIACEQALSKFLGR
jgi:hypothetical protein